MWIFCDLQTHLLFMTYRHILYSILWLTDTLYIVFCDLQTHFPFYDLQTLLKNRIACSTAKYLLVIWCYTVDPVGAEHITKTNLDKIFL